MDITNRVSDVRGTVAQGIEEKTGGLAGKALSFLYQTGMSMADSALQVGTMGKAATLFMGASAASNQAKDIIDRGGSNQQAFWGGLAAGAAEAAFEKFSIDNLLSTKSVTGWKSWLAETAKQAGVEASEEMFTEVANILSDAAIMMDRSNWALTVNGYIIQGMNADKARQKAFLDCVGQVALAGLGGAISGGVMGGTVNAVNGIRTAQEGYRDPFIQAVINIDKARSTSSTTSQTEQQYSNPLIQAMLGQGETSSTEETGTALIPVSETMRESLSTGKNNFVARTAEDIVSFVKRALGKKGGPERLYMGSLPEATVQKIKSETGVDVTGYNAILPGSAVQHIFNHHGNERTESTRGQRAVTAEDIALLPEVLAKPDSVQLLDDVDADGRSILLFSKQIGDIYVTAQGITDGRHALTTDTVWIRKRKTH